MPAAIKASAGYGAVMFISSEIKSGSGQPKQGAFRSMSMGEQVAIVQGMYFFGVTLPK